jgi:hypothetical protein
LIPKLGPKLKLKADRLQDQSGSSSSSTATYASGTPSPAARKIDEKIAPASITGTGKAGRITKEDAVMQCLLWELNWWFSWNRAYKIIDVAS